MNLATKTMTSSRQKVFFKRVTMSMLTSRVTMAKLLAVELQNAIVFIACQTLFYLNI